MKARAIARTVILAAALTLGISCKLPLVEGVRQVKTIHYDVVDPHPCTRKVIEGGLPTTCHVLFQKHENPLTREITKKAVHSQILQYHVLSSLIRDHGVRVVFLEGADISADVGKNMHAKCNEKCADNIWTRFRMCVINTVQLPCVGTHVRCMESSKWLSKHDAEDFCLAWNLLHTHHLRGLPTFLLILHNPSVLFTGIGKDQESIHQEVKKHRRLLKLRKYVEAVAGPKMGGVFEASIISAFKETVVKPRNKQRNRDAISEIILRPSQNTALVIGAGHKDSIERIIKLIPFHARPTFYFIMPECQDNPHFFVSSDVIDVAAIITAETRTKQNL